MKTSPLTHHTIKASTISDEDLSALRSTTKALPQGSPVSILLEHIILAFQSGHDITTLSTDKDLTPNQVATLLQVSRPHVYKLMDTGLLRFHQVGKDRRVHTTEVIDYIDRRERASAQMAEDLASRQADLNAVMDAAAPLSDDDIAELRS
ncbi:helix-turn-helix domain-containing protein [Actinomyces viscosus]|uniref:helix-turn-helix domain-containing protein n=1 Tax=Actinomyces viscosus TaxID=1656 RepID=UPI0028ECA28C|nr:helix-turn-helix domain-containing protein [Actinomyces viscosus]